MNQVNHYSPYKSTYRSEIDGLRAFAVLSVLAFHAFPGWLKGGFIGVDVFFVISGFLITTHIFESLDKGTFSFTDFFGRRIRRIFPALILVMACSLVLGWFALLADEYAQLGKHVASGAAFITNFILVDETGYFDNAAETKPMLHLWSLAVEEQFYIVWPLVLWLAWKLRFNLLTVTILVAVVSFYLNLIFVESHPTETFFWPVGRFWELLSGSVLAWLLLYKSETANVVKISVDKVLVRIIVSKQVVADGSITSNLMSFFGFLLLVFGIVRINESLFYPSMWALVPVLGAVLVIAGGSKAWLNRVFLMNPIAVWFGLISYPLYLWHWPILSIIYIQKGEELAFSESIYAVFISIFLAWATYFFIESKFRRGSSLGAKAVILIFLMLCVGLVGYLISEKRISSQVVIDDRAFDKGIFRKNCDAVFPTWNAVNDNKCLIQNSSGEVHTILIGDSHAAHLFDGFVSELGDKRSSAVFPSSCHSPLLNISSGFKAKDEKIRLMREQGYKFIAKALRFAQQSKSAKSIYLAHNPFCDTVIMDVDNPSEKDIEKIYANGFKRTLELFKNSDKQLFIVLDNPRLPYGPSACSERRLTLVNTKCDFDYSGANSIFLNAYEKQARIAAEVHSNVRVVDLKDIFCSNGECSMAPFGTNLYRDRTHLNFSGSKYAAKFLLDQE